MQRLTDCPSKPFGFYACWEWGLRNVKFLSPFSFSASKEGKEITFFVHVQDHTDKHEVSLPLFSEDYLILYIPNKEGDNCVVIDGKDCLGQLTINFKWIAVFLKRKFRINELHHTDNVFHDSRRDLPEEQEA
jgi:hypothetical protein